MQKVILIILLFAPAAHVSFSRNEKKTSAFSIARLKYEGGAIGIMILPQKSTFSHLLPKQPG